jgi:hypothetical protein
MGRRGWFGGMVLALVALAILGCSGAGTNPSVASPGSTAAGPRPAAPLNFAATITKEGDTCAGGARCAEWTFTWESNAGPDTSFRVYRGYLPLLGGVGCSSASATAELLVESKPGARSVTALTYVEPLAVRSILCHWITATDGTGESERVLETKASGQ